MNNRNVLPTVQWYNRELADGMLEHLGSMTTFAEVEAWDRDASVEVARISAHLEQFDRIESELQTIETQTKAAHAEKSFLGRIFSSPEHAAEIGSIRNKIRTERAGLSELAEGLQAGIDKTPNTKEEQKEMLQHLRLAKKELAQERRETNEAMRQIRTNARQTSAGIGAGVTGILFTTPTSRRLSRMNVRIQKESALSPHEDAKMGLERRILAVDRTILWVQRFQ